MDMEIYLLYDTCWHPWQGNLALHYPIGKGLVAR